MFTRIIAFILFLLCASTLFGQHKLTLEKLSSEINSAQYDEIAPVLSHDGQTLYFTKVGHPDFNKTLEIKGENLYVSLPRKQYYAYLAKIYSQIAGSPIQNAVTSAYNQDVWIASFQNNQFQALSHPTAPLNNALPNSICALTPERNTFVVLNQFLPGGGMDQGFSIVQKIGETWQFPQPMAIENYYTTGENVNVTMSPDGEVLLMSLQRKDSYGRNDLYVSFKNQVGGWTEPMNLGPNINSHFSEDTPTISIDKKTIYFSSNRTNSMGGRDIFRSRRNCESWTNWTIPRRFVGPINSNRDDSQPFFNDRTGYLYFTSNRAGSADIYRVQIANPKRDEVLVKGKIIDTQTEQPMAAKLLYGPTDLGHFLRFFRSKNGTFEFRMPKGKNYKVSAEKSNFLATQQIVETRKGTYYPTQEITIYLTPIKENATIKLAPIYFKQSEATILEKSFAALEELLAILQKNSTISIRIEGHTDNQGKPQDLLDLSEARAFAIKRYLMDQGVGSARIQTIGYGGTRPAKANTQRLRAQNRRVEVRIVKL